MDNLVNITCNITCLDVFNMFLAEKYILAGKIYVVSEGKIKKKAELSVFFFLSGLIPAHREESSTVEPHED